MLTLAELNALQAQVRAAEHRADVSKRTEERLARMRTGDKSLHEACVELQRYSSDEAFLKLVAGGINEFAADILRVLELRQEAIRRAATAEAAMKRAQLDALVAPEPPKTEGGGS